MATELVMKVNEALAYFGSTDPGKKLLRLYKAGDLVGVNEALKALPTYESLLSDLVAKLKGKSVFTTLKRVAEGKETDKFTKLKGLLSLSTHACIECEQGRSEYKLVLNRLFEQIAKEMYS